MAHSLVPVRSPNLAPIMATKNAGVKSQCTIRSSLHLRRELMYGLVGAGLASVTAESANAAKRTPPPPAVEKKDPSITGLRAKVLANIKRKEAMKEEIAKLRQKGKPVNS